MKKKLLTLVLALSCTASLVGCAAKEAVSTEPAVETTAEETTVEETTVEETTVEETTVEETKEASVSAPANVPSELSDDIYSFQVSVNGTVYQFPMWAADFQALGWEYDGDASTTIATNQYTGAETWVKDGVEVYTTLANLTMNSLPLDQSMVAGIEFDKYNMKECDWEIVLPKGITYGVSTTEDIIAAYGDPSSDYDGDLYYKMSYEADTYSEIDFYVYKESGVLEEIEIRNIIELEGGDNSVSEEVPELVKSYKAPSALGDDLYTFNFKLEGNMYTLPCPVSELLANGFTLVEEGTEQAIGAQNFGWVELRYNNQTYRAIARNYADFATTPENCFLTSIKSSIHGPEYDLEIPCGIKRGMKEADLLKAIANFNYEEDESGSFKYYDIYNPNGRKSDSIEISVTDGVVAIIEMDNSEKPEY